MMYVIIGLLVVFSLWFGLYVGIVGGIVTIAGAVKTDPVNVGGVLWGVVKFFGCPAVCNGLTKAILG